MEEIFREPFETGHLLWLSASWWDEVTQVISQRPWSLKLRKARTPVIWSLNKDAILEAFSREMSLIFQDLISGETAKILILVPMINKLKPSITHHVFTDLQEVAYILLLSTELVYKLGFACLATGTSELNKRYLHSVFMLVAMSCVYHGFACARIMHW